MSIRFEFGNRKNPTGNLSKEEWEKLQPRWKQIRSDQIAEVKFSGEECGQVDALWTRQSGIPLGVTTADCVPILLYRKDEAAVGVIHAGWEGTLVRIVPKFFAALPDDLKTPSEWVAKLGPSIRACCYEFGEDLLAQFRTEFSDLSEGEIAPTPRHLDLIAILSHELKRLGVAIESVDPQCTYCTRELNGDLRFFSYRQGDRNSRQYSIVSK
jgi:YfiH family protein